MLRFFDPRSHSRRDFLGVGSLALGGGMTLPGLLAAQARAAAGGVDLPVTDKAVIFLFMHGGPPQHEMFDPKMDRPMEIRSATGEIPTTLAGITYGSTLQRLAKLAHKTAVVRSFTTGSGNHDIKPIVCKETLNANMGALYTRVAGVNNTDTGMPINAVLFPRAVDPTAQEGVSQFGKFPSTGNLGPAYTPFVPSTGGDLQNDMKLWMPRTRLDDRRSLLQALDTIRRRIDVSGKLDGADRFTQQAYDVILGGIANAFDLSKEDPAVVARYDTSKLVHPDSISRKWNNHDNYRDHGQTLGKLMLLARRLVEAGARFITVTTSFVWDMHADQNNATMDEGMRYCGEPFDHAVATFIEDCESRGLGDKILLVCCGEMGRTPKINKKGGRDHWGGSAPLLLYGGGMNMGQVIGASDLDGAQPSVTPVNIDHLMATIMHTLLDIGKVRTRADLPTDVLAALTRSEPIPGLM
ncbi:MAG: DUF1501 domain-containing protein [Phycisphaera sp.]|nr:DUF1501 domain-containing protein [Phycisphaera sp.]